MKTISLRLKYAQVGNSGTRLGKVLIPDQIEGMYLSTELEPAMIFGNTIWKLELFSKPEQGRASGRALITVRKIEVLAAGARTMQGKQACPVKTRSRAQAQIGP